MTPRGTVLTLVLGVALFAGSYGVGRAAGEGGKSESPPAATVPEIGGLEAAKPLPRLVERAPRQAAPEPPPAVATEPEPDPQPEAAPAPVEPVTPTPAPTPEPEPAPAPTPAPPAPGGDGFDDSG